MSQPEGPQPTAHERTSVWPRLEGPGRQDPWDSPQAGASGTWWGSQDRKLGGQFPVRRHEPQDDLCVSPPSQGLGKDAQQHQPKATRKALETSSLRGKDPTDVTARALGSASCTGAQGHPTGTQALNQTGARTSFLLVSPLGEQPPSLSSIF